MDFKKGCLWTASVCLGLSLSLSPQQQKEQASPEKHPAGIKPLVRKDLLNFGEPPPSLPLRNIFRPKSSASRGPVTRAPAPRRPEPKAPPPPDEPSFALVLNYIGSVQSGGRTMALVVRSGEALPLAEGEEAAPGYRVIRITPLEIEVEGPGGERKVFARQGDR
jgi:hypothetical protein